jgi:hypothetical protein
MKRATRLGVRGHVKGLCCGLFSASLLLVVLPGTARADASAWAFAGAGALAWKEGTAKLAPYAAMTFDFGVGTTPDAKVIFGGLFRLTPVIDKGADGALCARIASHGFQAGDFGVALDVGGYQRFWGSYSRGATGALTIGFPLGFSLSFQGLYGTNDALAVGAIAGIDFLRLTVYRQVLLDTWPNPYPAHELPQKARGPAWLPAFGGTPGTAAGSPARFF